MSEFANAFCYVTVRSVISILPQLLLDSFRGMGVWRKTIEPQKPDNFQGPGPEVVENQSRPGASGAKSP